MRSNRFLSASAVNELRTVPSTRWEMAQLVRFGDSDDAAAHAYNAAGRSNCFFGRRYLGRAAALPPNVCRIRAGSKAGETSELAPHSRSRSRSISRRDGTRANDGEAFQYLIAKRHEAVLARASEPDKNAFAFQAGSQSPLVRGTRWQHARRNRHHLRYGSSKRAVEMPRPRA
ncbi:hypothetical protein MTO96_001949 [Rhipicephalus appendiculatus]